MGGTAPFETLDRLSCVELRSHGLPSGVVAQLYTLARHGDPLCLQAARALAEESVRRTAFFTGVVHEKQPHGELDGPVGCAVLAAALTRLGREAVVFAPAAAIPVLAAAREACGGGFAVEPDSGAEPAGFDAAVSIERLGRNRKGVHHSIFGVPREQPAVADDFFEALNASGRSTIGIGDGGNEIGFGSIFAAARRVVPRGRECGCPCGDGIVTRTRARCLLVASVSNFGAYAVTAALALIAGNPELAPQPGTVVAAMSAAVEAGGIDGGSMIPGVVADDGIAAGAVAAVVTLMRATVEMATVESAHVGVGV
jgi:D-glutamate cyclase